MELARLAFGFALTVVSAACLSRPSGGSPTAETPAAREVDPITGRPLEPLGPEGPRHEHVRVVERDPKDEHEVKIPLHTQQELEACHAKGGGKVRVKLTRAGGKRGFEVIGAKSLDPSEQRCVLDALQRLRDDETPGALGAQADVPATGFTSLLTLEW